MVKNDGLISIAGIVLCLAVSCAWSSKEKVQLEETHEAEAQTDTKKHTEKGPVLRLRFGDGQVEDHKDGLPPHGPLKEAEIKGPSTTDLESLALRGEKDKKSLAAASEGETHPSLSCAGVAGLYALLLAGAVLFAWRLLRRSA